MSYSNVTPEEMAAILEQLKTKRREEIKLPERIRQGKPLVCKYATDTGERAFANLPCRGNKIICGKIEGHTSYTSACNPGNCKFFEKKEEES
jgi:hypothetical protein